ncbi:DNA translocase FtsK [Oceaniserpentilla sp. 4NH20-0058]|uniref:DNA translocase FtsK n=1 Tax=Oceaniserpentilla sp. 4NH20-0058 TaxID=3127660 RepID=UPI003105AAD9
MLQNKEKVNVDWHSQFAAVLKEGRIFLLVAIAVFLMISLLSYDPQDPGWRQAQSSAFILNYGGQVGAFVSDLLYSLLGYMAFVLALIPMLRGIQRLKGANIQYGWAGWLWRFTGVLIVVISGSILTHLYDGTNVLPAGSGGVIGQHFSTIFASYFGFVGASLIFSLSFLFGLTVCGDIAWLATLDLIGEKTLSLIALIKRQMNRINDKRNARKEAKEIVSHIDDKIQTRPVHALPENSAPIESISIPPVLSEKVDKIVKSPLKAIKEKTQAVIEDKKIIIKPFEKKSKGNGIVQGKLFEPAELPSLGLLSHQDGPQETGYSAEKLEEMSRLLEQKLQDFGVKIEVVAVNPGPVITRFEIQPAPGVKASKITNLASDLARSLAMISVRVVEVIPGKSVMGLEVPNENRAMVFLGDVLASTEYQKMTSPLSFALGHDIAGDPVTADLAKMPHLLVAGTTGSGKSVGVNSMLISMLYKAGPEDVRMIMVDPKMLELSIYDGIPHLLTPVITDMKEAANGLRWCVGEMERRYKLMATMGVRNIAGYNKKVLEAIEAGEPLKDPLWKPEESFDPTPPDLGKLPYIVVVIDEFADMMMIVGKKVEELIARIAQKARAAGIHLILATQRPSVDIITGLIKANVPTRMAFQVSSRIDSRTILDQGGAEQLLGHGDMLYLPPGTSLPIRVHGAFVDDHEVHAVVADWKKRGEPEYIESITDGCDNSVSIPGFANDSEEGEADVLFDEAVAFVTQTRKVSISSVQRKLRIGYNRAARLVETMEQAGVVSTPSQNGSREVLAPPPVSS